MIPKRTLNFEGTHDDRNHVPSAVWEDVQSIPKVYK